MFTPQPLRQASACSSSSSCHLQDAGTRSPAHCLASGPEKDPKGKQEWLIMQQSPSLRLAASLFQILQE